MIILFVGFHFAVQKLKTEVQAALGPQSEVGNIALSWNAVEVSNLRIRAPEGWPDEDTLRADKISIVPELRGLLDGDIHIARIEVQGAYLSVWRTSKGKLRLLPSLLEKPSDATHSDAEGASHQSGP